MDLRTTVNASLALLLTAFLGGPATAQPMPPAVARAGTPGPATLVRDLVPGDGPGGPIGLRPFGDRVLGYTFDLQATTGDGFLDWLYRSDLIVSDGTAPGTLPLLPADVSFAWWLPDAGSDRLTFFATCASPVTIGYACTDRPNALWRTDGTVAGTFQISDEVTLQPVAGGLPDGFYLKERDLYLFRGTPTGEEEKNYELWATDGTAEGTHLVADLNPAGSSFPGNMTQLGSFVYFTYKVGTENGDRWLVGRTDGTAAGTEARSGPADPGATPFWLLRGDDEIFVFWDVLGESLSLWREDGSPQGPQPVAEDLGPRSRYGLRFADVGGRQLYFLLGDYYHGRGNDTQLWVSDGTPAATRQLPRPDGTVLHDGYAHQDFVVVGERFYFRLDDGVHGSEPWVSDGTVAGTHMIQDLCPGACRAKLVNTWGFHELLGEVLLGLDGDYDPTWPLAYDPETDTVHPLSNLCPGGCRSPRVLAQAGGRAYLFLYDSEHGDELWTTDGTTAGTARLSDFGDDPFRVFLFAGSYEESPTARAGRHLFFGAKDDAHGWELWAVPLPAEGIDYPQRPDRPPLTSPELPGFAFWTEITPGSGAAVPGRAEAACIPETLCVSGAVPNRSEVFVRIVGPKPNGFLWPTLVKFTTSTVEVWIEQLSTGAVRYYRLEGASPGSSALPGLFDREGFTPE